MLENPFSPIFGGKPSFFFGRKDILSRFELAMIDQGSDDRALFVTGTRGSGKTALLEQFSMRARAKKRKTIDLGPDDTVIQLIRALAAHDELTTTVSPQANVTILGVGGGLSAGSVSKTAHYGRESLQPLLLKACEEAKNGLLVTIDEIQKVPIEDVSALCNAFQMASRKGHDIMLAVAGLPYARESVIHHNGCTYLRRAPHEELGLFSWDEAAEAYESAFSQVSGLRISNAQIGRLNEASYGHPYMMQLLGYYLVSHINKKANIRQYEVKEDDLDQTIPLATVSYEQRALRPLLDELSETERKYLVAMSKNLDGERMAFTSVVANALGKPQESLSRARAKLIGNGIIAAPERGKVMFCIPYLADYVLKEEAVSTPVDIARKRRV